MQKMLSFSSLTADIVKIKLQNYSSCKAAYRTSLRNVDFRRLLLQQYTLVALISDWQPRLTHGSGRKRIR